MSNRTVPAPAEGLPEITTTTTDPMLDALHELRIRVVTHIQVAWLAFDRRLAVHVRAAPFAGRA